MVNIPTGDEDVASFGRARSLQAVPVDLFPATASLTAEAIHLEKVVDFDSASNLNYTVTSDTVNTKPFRPGNCLYVKRTGAGTVTFVAGSGVTINTAEDGLIIQQHGIGMLMKDRAANTWTAFGKLAAT